MELIELITSANDVIEQFFVLRTFKFILGMVVVLLGLNITLLLYVLLVKDKYIRGFSMGHGVPDIIGSRQSGWNKVRGLIMSGDTTQQKQAVNLSADMLEEMLEVIGHEGDSLREQLDDMIGKQLANIDDLKDANSLNVRIQNDQEYEPTSEELTDATRAFGEALREHETIKEVGL